MVQSLLQQEASEHRSRSWVSEREESRGMVMRVAAHTWAAKRSWKNRAATKALQCWVEWAGEQQKFVRHCSFPLWVWKRYADRKRMQQGAYLDLAVAFDTLRCRQVFRAWLRQKDHSQAVEKKWRGLLRERQLKSGLVALAAWHTWAAVQGATRRRIMDTMMRSQQAWMYAARFAQLRLYAYCRARRRERRQKFGQQLTLALPGAGGPLAIPALSFPSPLAGVAVDSAPLEAIAARYKQRDLEDLAACQWRFSHQGRRMFLAWHNFIQKLKKARSCWMGSLRRRAFKQLKYKTRWARTKRNADEEIEQKRRLDRSREGARAEEEDYFEELMLPSEKAARRKAKLGRAGTSAAAANRLSAEAEYREQRKAAEEAQAQAEEQAAKQRAKEEESDRDMRAQIAAIMAEDDGETLGDMLGGDDEEGAAAVLAEGAEEAAVQIQAAFRGHLGRLSLLPDDELELHHLRREIEKTNAAIARLQAKQVAMAEQWVSVTVVPLCSPVPVVTIGARVLAPIPPWGHRTLMCVFAGFTQPRPQLNLHGCWLQQAEEDQGEQKLSEAEKTRQHDEYEVAAASTSSEMRLLRRERKQLEQDIEFVLEGGLDDSASQDQSEEEPDDAVRRPSKYDSVCAEAAKSVQSGGAHLVQVRRRENRVAAEIERINEEQARLAKALAKRNSAFAEELAKLQARMQERMDAASSGENPLISMLEQLCDAFGIGLDAVARARQRNLSIKIFLKLAKPVQIRKARASWRRQLMRSHLDTLRRYTAMMRAIRQVAHVRFRCFYVVFRRCDPPSPAASGSILTHGGGTRADGGRRRGASASTARAACASRSNAAALCSFALARGCATRRTQPTAAGATRCSRAGLSSSSARWRGASCASCTKRYRRCGGAGSRSSCAAAHLSPPPRYRTNDPLRRRRCSSGSSLSTRARRWVTWRRTCLRMSRSGNTAYARRLGCFRTDTGGSIAARSRSGATWGSLQ